MEFSSLQLNPYNDFNGRSQMGFGVPHATLRDGLRCSANKAYLRPIWRRSNLDILLKAFVQEIIIDPYTKEARGVRFDWFGKKYTALADREVILSAGTIASPQLLMVSGVGPKENLIDLDIDVIQDLAGVGGNLQDHIATIGAQYLIDNRITGHRMSFIVPEMFNAKSVDKFLHHADGFFYAVPIAEVMGFWNSKYQNSHKDWPDVQIFLGSYGLSSDGGILGSHGSSLTLNNYAQVFEPSIYKDNFMIVPLIMRPKSRGWLDIKSKHNKVYPEIHANYYDHPLDMAVMVNKIY